MKGKNKIIISILLCVLVLFTSVGVALSSTVNSFASTNNSIKIHFKSTKWKNPNIYYWNSLPENIEVSWPGKQMTAEGNDWYGYEFKNKDKINFLFNKDGEQTNDLTRNAGEWWYKDGIWTAYNPEEITKTEGDFRDETIYFVMTSRFYDGYYDNNVHCWDDKQAGNTDADPAWRGDFQGLIDKLDYIKAMGFSALWITPVVDNASGYDYHGYHAINFKRVDPRLESPGATYQDLINAVHAKGMKVIQDIVLNHTSNFGEENLFQMFVKQGDLSSPSCMIKTDPNKVLPANYDTMPPQQQYEVARIGAMKSDNTDVNNIYHHEKSLSWESYTVQTGQIAGDCVDLNTENPAVAKYLREAYTQYINMGVDSFRVDTVKHISRLTFNNEFLPQFKAAGGDDFYIFGENCARYRNVWNSNNPAISVPFYSWKESKNYPWGDVATNMNSTLQEYNDNQNIGTQPTSDNAFLKGNEYHTPDRSKSSGMDLIDFPMHWSFNNAYDAFNMALGGDKYYNDATWNVTYVDSHDYAPDGAPENQRFAGSQDTWAENLNLMYTFRGIPCIYYGSEIEFMKGKPIDVGPKEPLNKTGRAYFGDNIEGTVQVSDFGVYKNATGNMAATLSHPLAKHIQRLNVIRRAVPALRKGQYSTEGVSGNGMAFKRGYKDDKVNSFVCVSISGGSTFSGIPNGTYVDAITGTSKNVSNGTLSVESTSKGNMRVYVLQNSTTSTGKIGEDGLYLK